jgi:signal transduction histidine kinase
MLSKAQYTTPSKSQYSIEEYLRMAVQKESEKDYRQASHYLNEAAMLEQEQKNYTKAAEHFEHSLELNRNIGNENGIAGISSSLAMIYNDMGDYEKSLQYFNVTLKSRKERKEKEGTFDALVNISIILKNLRRYPESISKLEEALDLAKETYDVEKMRLCYGTLAEFAEKAGMPDKTAYYFSMYRSFHDQIVKDRDRKIIDVTAKVEKAQYEAKLAELEKREKELELSVKEKEVKDQRSQISKIGAERQLLFQQLSEEKKYLAYVEQREKAQTAELNAEKIKTELAQDRLRQEKLWRYVWIVGAVFLGLLVIILFRNNINRRRANALLATQRNALQQSNHVKDKLFSIIAHDLRTPFSGIRGLLMLLERGLLDETEQAEMLTQLKATSDNTLDTLDTLLEWASGQMHGINTSPESVDLHKIVQKNIELLDSPARQKDIELLNQTAHNTNAWADESQITTVLRNLISNAIKFTPQKGKISISATQSADQWHIAVQDSGIGIPTEKLSKLFNPESHFSTRGTANEKGTGLGLLLVKEFVEKNSGEISVKSEQGTGTTFSFTLPISKEKELDSSQKA